MIPYAFVRYAGYEFGAPVRYYRPLYQLWSYFCFLLFHFYTPGWHLCSVLAHVTVTAAVYWFARALKQSHWVAALAALLFGIHPVHVEVVSWLSAVEDALATLFSLAAFLSFLRATGREGPAAFRWRICSCVFFLAALWSKEIAVLFPAIVFSFCSLTGQGHRREKLKLSVYQALPYATVTVFYMIQRQWAFGHIAQISRDYEIKQVLLTLPGVLLRYLRLLLWPVGLNPLYEIPYVSAPTLVTVLLPVVALGAVFVFIRWWSKRTRDPIVAFLGVWMLLNLVPVLYLPALNSGEFVRDRYLYLSSVGFALLASKAFCYLFELRREWVFELAITTVLLAAALITATVVQQAQWSNDLALFERAYHLNSKNDHAKLDYALVLMNLGDYEHARSLLEAVAAKHPAAPILHINLAIVYGNEGKRSRSAAELLETFSLEPDYANNLITKLELARAYEALGKYPQALVVLEEIWRRSPDYFRVAVEMARVYNNLGNPLEAERWARHDLTIEPHDAEAHCQLALALQKEDHAAEAAQESRAADEIYPPLKCNPDAGQLPTVDAP